MSSSREDSPDWLRSFQAPTSALTLSSDSYNSSPNGSPLRKDKTDDDDDTLLHSSSTLEKSNRNRDEVDQTPSKKKKKNVLKKSEGNGDDGDVATEETSKKRSRSHAANRSIWTLSSDSESSPSHSPKREETISLTQESEEANDPVMTGRGEESPQKKTSKGKSPKKGLKVKGQTPKKEKNVKDEAKLTENDGNMETAEEEASEKNIEPHVSTSRLPLVLSEKVHRSKALIECEGDSVDLSGDLGAVGRIVISDSASEDHDMLLDLKGTIYKTTIVPSRTFCIVEAIMNDFIQLKPQSNVYEAETMVEGTLDGFTFDSEDELDKMPKTNDQTDQNEDIVGEMNGKAKGKGKGKADKASTSRKRGKPAGAKQQPATKARKKTAVSKKSKAKK
ncbi:hypothetical protein CCACVL1_05547 [Corchorus capsularis]|uniref:DNA-binding protein BIN4 n=1 Tax=Corchorus capsularis TaxID=210143 RepID=A0A1R3JJY4_COCAP|nr:hypothetical protein CCACVL1_05547 [Corchorus capsularis]